MSNSPLVTYTKRSPNCNKPRNHVIDTISIHCTAGNKNNTAKQIANLERFITYDPENGASCNYAVGGDGSIALCVDEANRSWCTSSPSNDHRAITIEVASNIAGTEVNDAAYAALLDLLTDICKRNGIKKLLWKGDKSLIGKVSQQNMTVHRWFANKSCPGDYLYNRHGQIAAEVNRRLGASTEPSKPPAGDAPDMNVGATVDFTGVKHYVSSTAKTGSTCKPGKATVTAKAPGKAHPYHLKAVPGGGSTVYGWVDAADISALGSGEPEAISYRVRVTANELNIRKGPGTNFGANCSIKDKGVYTIVAESAGSGASKWGKLKSGAGWISLDYCTKL